MGVVRKLVQGRAGRVMAWVLVVGLAVPALAHAAQFVVNGVPIGKVELSVQGLEGITFEKCASVKVDANGDVKVDCPGYDLQAAAPAAAQDNSAPIVPGKITKRYWIVTEQKEKGATQFDVDLYINAKWIKRFKNNDEQIVDEITKYLVPGKNKVLFAATKNVADGRKATSPNLFYRFVIGEGEIGGGNVMIDNPLIDLRRTAAESENVTEERELIAR